ncbi:type IV pilin protein [Sutcliffiella sp. NPDC057660]|uniref:type IV pilin protein n=1 Tax=Sutcliffiella sp. NPDC057660 TaxID=3346199 RepID=UPI00367F9FCE
MVKKKFLSDNYGITLMEVLVTVVILGIIAAIAVPSIKGLISKTEADVSEANRLELRRMYKEGRL